RQQLIAVADPEGEVDVRPSIERVDAAAPGDSAAADPVVVARPRQQLGPKGLPFLGTEHHRPLSFRSGPWIPDREPVVRDRTRHDPGCIPGADHYDVGHGGSIAPASR